MDLRQISPTLAVSAQLTPADVASLAQAGFKVLINNRPDDEIEAGLDHDAMAAAAADAGMAYHYQPFFPGQITPQLIADFGAATDGGAPVVAYCRTGNRCTVLWALNQAGKTPVSEIMATAHQAGYDLTGVRPLIESLANQNR
ncbi:TIGR01244 family sulfur transferase [Paracoccus sp. (in: a-proteobacteria)]|uniref:TIGR01244 family sulfur transferase n=1 Tax=Paracoccus sp. TaxID=267 RepID=UPI0026E08245|nr:TIGR01244 family sulfur transferase [Paracoccus sp. (in: a-proteobacteria)]MDO5646768.1 TIGR01244 family sulfur transferase [Paracoccus sp. (in: a-proteobacteria)]